MTRLTNLMKKPMTEILSFLPHSPLPYELNLIVSALLVSVLAAFVALLRNRRLIAAPSDDEQSDLGTLFANPSSVLPHLVELRQRVVRMVAAIVIGTLIAAVIAEQILFVLARPIGGLENLLVIRVTESVAVFFRVALVSGIILASPFILAQLWIFIAAGLRPNERRIFYLLFPFATLLFLAGVAFAYFVMLPVAVPFLVGFLEINAEPTLDDYIGFITTILLFVGLSFEMPLILFGLAKVGVVNSKMLLKNWRIAIVLIAIVSAVITPTPDPFNMSIVAAPLILLYVLSIVLTTFA